jgi:Arc/MetJ family transcription regulator
MRTTITVDDALLASAKEMSGLKETGPLVRAALQALIQREAALRLARLGGTEPLLEDIPRRRDFGKRNSPRRSRK